MREYLFSDAGDAVVDLGRPRDAAHALALARAFGLRVTVLTYEPAGEETLADHTGRDGDGRDGDGRPP